MNPFIIPAITCAAAPLAGAPLPVRAVADSSSYKGWRTLRMANGLVELQVLAGIGGRILQFRLGSKEFLWNDPGLAGRMPTATGLNPDGGWFNVGGDKIWPAPQGWAGPEEWPGPPDAVLDGQPYRLERLRSLRGDAAIRLTSRRDARSGIQFVRVVRLSGDSTRVSFVATMRNIDTRSRRWGIWAHTQLDAGRADGSGPNALMKAWCPLNPDSRFPRGYDVIFGLPDNPSFQANRAAGLMGVQYLYRVGKIGLDSRAGWVATVDGESGAAFVQRFVYEPGREYPDGSSVEFWHNGVGRIHAYNRDMEMATTPSENPCVFESEVLSPFARLEPGESSTFRYDWYACNLGGDFPALDCTTAGVTAVRLTADCEPGGLRLRGRFGVFAPGALRADALDRRGRRVGRIDWSSAVSPLAPAVVDAVVHAPAGATSVRVLLEGVSGRAMGELARAEIGARRDAGR